MQLWNLAPTRSFFCTQSTVAKIRSCARPECKSRLNFAGVLFFFPSLSLVARGIISFNPENREEWRNGGGGGRILHGNLGRGHDFNCVLESGVQLRPFPKELTWTAFG